MKSFYFASGYKAGQTITVTELIKKLGEYPKETPVFAQWEGCIAYIEPENFAVVDINKGSLQDECTCLVIDVNQY